MRSSLLALVLAVPALAAAGCGAGQIAADEVPGGPPILTVPSDTALGAAGSKADASSSSSSSSSSEESADSSTSSDGGTADSGTTSTGTPTATTTPAPTATAAPEDTTGGSAPPPAGSSPEQFENFCEQNAGAC
jgi:hypothetical protein